MTSNRRNVLAGLLVLAVALSALALVEVLATVFFAITLAYVLYPVRRRIVRRGFSPRVAAATMTTFAFAALLSLVAPVTFVLYRRRFVLLDLIRSFPDRIPLEYAEFRYVVEMAPLLAAARNFVTSLALAIASAAPVLALKLLLFGFLLYGLFYRPVAAGEAVLGVVPAAYRDVVLALHRRVHETLLALYVLQAATAAGTFAVAFVLFALLGFEAAFTLAVLSAVLQFIPVLGPSVVVAAIAVGDVLAGNLLHGAATLVLGFLLVGFLPDAVIRPQLAGLASDLPVSLYFVGFVGGVLSLGAVGFIVGPLVVALLLEVAALVAAEEGIAVETVADSDDVR